MTPADLQWALDGNREVRTDGGSGPAVVRQLADLVLPTGRVLIGYPGSPLINEPSPVRPLVPPGRYPVFATLVDLPSGFRDLAYVVACFQEGPPQSWEEAGAFFTDSGTGCLMDESCVPLLEQLGEKEPDFWRRLYDLKSGVSGEGDCNLLLEETSGANAILFRTHDARYPCFLGRGRNHCPAWLVIDCR